MPRYVRRAARRDAAEAPIVDALLKAGAWVHSMDAHADLLVLYPLPRQVVAGTWLPGVWNVLEVKTGRGKKLSIAQDKRQRAQKNFLELTHTPKVRTPREALLAVGAILEYAH